MLIPYVSEILEPEPGPLHFGVELYYQTRANIFVFGRRRDGEPSFDVHAAHLDQFPVRNHIFLLLILEPLVLGAHHNLLPIPLFLSDCPSTCSRCRKC